MSAPIEPSSGTKAPRTIEFGDLKAVLRDKHRAKNEHHGGQKMVSWYNVTQLARTALEVVISSTLGRHNDRRLFQALENKGRPEHFNDFSVNYKFDENALGNYVATTEKCEDIWIDYVSDLGDGWDPTYAVAHYLSQEKLILDGHETERGKILIMGGDEVYPTATSEEYESRLEKPYRDAMTSNEPGKHPFLFAIPGNHDWYDSLVNFSRIFLNAEYFAKDKETKPVSNVKVKQDSQDQVPGRWRVPQERSYFVLKLPHGWWLVGIDLQLDSDLDGEQIEYLRSAAEDMSDGDKIILCSPEPYWVYAEIYKDVNEFDSKYVENRLNKNFLEEKVFTKYNHLGKEIKKQKIAVYLAGDLHHYYHIETDDHAHKITAGGGGAFLHPTHGALDGAFKKEFRTAFPSSAESRKYTWLNIFFPLLNRTFGFLTMVLYLLSSWSVWAFIRMSDDDTVNLKSYFGTTMLTKEDPRIHFLVTLLGSWFNPIYDFFDFWIFAFEKTALVGMRTPVVALWALVFVGGFLLFTDTSSKTYRIYGSLIHGIFHVIAAFLINWTSFWVTTHLHSNELNFFTWLVIAGGIAILVTIYFIWQQMNNWLAVGVTVVLLFFSILASATHLPNEYFWNETYHWGWNYDTPNQIFFCGLIICGLSYFAGSIILGLYLWLSLNRRGRHANEAFSSLGIQDWKNFLRLHINKEGYLTIYPIGIQRVPRYWEKIELKNKAITYEPADSQASLPELIEREIIIDPPLFS